MLTLYRVYFAPCVGDNVLHQNKTPLFLLLALNTL